MKSTEQDPLWSVPGRAASGFWRASAPRTEEEEHSPFQDDVPEIREPVARSSNESQELFPSAFDQELSLFEDHDTPRAAGLRALDDLFEEMEEQRDGPLIEIEDDPESVFDDPEDPARAVTAAPLEEEAPTEEQPPEPVFRQPVFEFSREDEGPAREPSVMDRLKGWLRRG